MYLTEIGKIEKAVDALPKRRRDALMRRLAEKWEDHLDMKAALEAIAEGEFDTWENAKKRLDAKRHHHKTRRKVSR